MRIVIFRPEGTVRKCNTTLNLGVGLARMGRSSVEMVDLDPHAHLTRGLGMEPGLDDWTARDWAEGREGRARLVPGQTYGQGRLSLVPGHAGITLSDRNLPAHSSADWVLMDAGPNWTPGLVQVLRHAQMLLCPVEADFHGMNSVAQIVGQMQAAGLPKTMLRLLLCRFSNRLVLHREVRSKMTERFGVNLLLPVVIRSSNRLIEVPAEGKSIFDYAPQSTGAADFASLAEALMVERRLASVRRQKMAAS